VEELLQELLEVSQYPAMTLKECRPKKEVVVLEKDLEELVDLKEERESLLVERHNVVRAIEGIMPYSFSNVDK
jgi:t-SNARE complex subunit (syntaxin)